MACLGCVKSTYSLCRNCQGGEKSNKNHLSKSALTCLFQKRYLPLPNVGRRPVYLHPITKLYTPDAEKGIKE